MTVEGEYLGMQLAVPDNDGENLEYFRHCAAHDFRLQQCASCKLLRYPPTTACPWCQSAEAEWTSVEGKGEIHSYAEIHHPIQPAFQSRTPYLLLLVELARQKGQPTEHEALRVVGNLVTPEGELAAADEVRRVGIGSRMRMVFVDVAEGLSLPQWTLEESARQPSEPWRYAQE